METRPSGSLGTTECRDSGGQDARDESEKRSLTLLAKYHRLAAFRSSRPNDSPLKFRLLSAKAMGADEALCPQCFRFRDRGAPEHIHRGTHESSTRPR